MAFFSGTGVLMHDGKEIVNGLWEVEQPHAGRGTTDTVVRSYDEKSKKAVEVLRLPGIWGCDWRAHPHATLTQNPSTI